MTTASASEVARSIVDAFEKRATPYAIGGALALGVWGFPRATKDVDVDVFVDVALHPEVFDALREAGCRVDATEATTQALERGDFQAWYGPMRVDVFVPSISFYQQMAQRRRQAPLEGRPAWFLSPEDLAVMKMMFFRTKDLLDVERLVAIAGESFDRVYVATALLDLVGADDARLLRWSQLLEMVDGRSQRR